MNCVATPGYLRFPHIHGDLLAFVASCGPVEEPVCIDRYAQDFLASQRFGMIEGVTIAVRGGQV